MSLISGVPIAVIGQHLAVLYAITINPERGKHAFEHVYRVGEAVAAEIIAPWYEMYGSTNTDHCEAGAFGQSDVATLEDKLIEAANKMRDDILREAELPGYAYERDSENR
jgi:hypothetical protein